jgi:hypothetical protein
LFLGESLDGTEAAVWGRLLLLYAVALGFALLPNDEICCGFSSTGLALAAALCLGSIFVSCFYCFLSCSVYYFPNLPIKLG